MEIDDAELVRLGEALEDLGERMEALKLEMMRSYTGGEIRTLVFNGQVSGGFQVLDDKGSDALSYGIYNPTKFKVMVGLAGLPPSQSGLVVPAHKLVVAPLQVNGSVQLKIDPEELGEESASILRIRFPLPQPFFVGSLE